MIDLVSWLKQVGDGQPASIRVDWDGNCVLRVGITHEETMTWYELQRRVVQESPES